MVPVRIYFVGGCDTDEIIALDAKCFPADTRYRGSSIPGAHYWWEARAGGKVVGYCGLKIYEDGKTGFLCRVGVACSHRRMGLHKKMLKRREEFARSRGVEVLYTYTSLDNYQSANNLVRAGYLLCPPWWSGNTDDVLCFYKNL